MAGKPPTYKVLFHNQGSLYEVYVRKVGQGALFGFVELEGFIFGERNSVVVDPSEERLKAEFQGVQRTYIPMHAIVRIDEVDREGPPKAIDLGGSNVTPFPFPVYTPGGPEKR